MEIVPSKRQRSPWVDLATFLKQAGLSVQMRIMFYVGVTDLKHFRKVLSVHPKFKKITEYEDFHQKINLDAIPWMSWKKPTSVEYAFLALCHRAGNPEIFFRFLIVDVFEHNRFIRVNEFLEKVVVGGHRDALYASIVFRVLTNDEFFRSQAIQAMETMLNQECGRWILEASRNSMCYRLYDYVNGFTSGDRPPLHPYCLIHPFPDIYRRLTIDCARCMCDLECVVYHERAMLRIILNGDN